MAEEREEGATRLALDDDICTSRIHRFFSDTNINQRFVVFDIEREEGATRLAPDDMIL